MVFKYNTACTVRSDYKKTCHQKQVSSQSLADQVTQRNRLFLQRLGFTVLQ